jgi:hypothetical protein
LKRHRPTSHRSLQQQSSSYLLRFLAIAILSTKLGYGRPAAFALALAAAFFCGVKGFDLPSDAGLCFSQTGLLVAIVPPVSP